MTLGEFLLEAAKSRTPWNCSTLPADWCIALGHPDYAAAWRHLSEEAECEEAQASGLLPLWARGIGSALPVVDQLALGDIGVVRYLGFEAGAIFTGERWALRSRRGLVCAPFPASAVLRAWRP